MRRFLPAKIGIGSAKTFWRVFDFLLVRAHKTDCGACKSAPRDPTGYYIQKAALSDSNHECFRGYGVRCPKFSPKSGPTMEPAHPRGYCRMTRFDKPLLLMAAANFFAAFVAVSAGAETVNDPDARIVRLEAQIAAARDDIRIAQGYGRPPGEIGEPGDVPYAGEQQDVTQQVPRVSLSGSDGLKARCGRSTARSNRCSLRPGKLAEQLKKFQEDVDFRFPRGRRPGAPAAKPAAETQRSGRNSNNADAQLAAQCRRGCPHRARTGTATPLIPSQNPGAPGAPRPLGGLALGAVRTRQARSDDESTPPDLIRNEPGAPLDLSNGRSPDGWAATSCASAAIAPAGCPGLRRHHAGRHGDRCGAQLPRERNSTSP